MIKRAILLSVIVGVLNYVLGVLIVNKYGLSARGFIEVINSIVGVVLSVLSFNYYTSITKNVALNKSLPAYRGKLNIKIQIIQFISALAIGLYYFKSTGLDGKFNATHWIIFVGIVVVIGHWININIAALNGLVKLNETKYVNLFGVVAGFAALLLFAKDEYIDIEKFIGLYFLMIYVSQYVASKSYIANIKTLKIQEEINLTYLNSGSMLYIISMFQLGLSPTACYRWGEPRLSLARRSPRSRGSILSWRSA